MHDDIRLHCLYGDDFYALTNGTKFLGCCESQLDKTGQCPPREVTAASFDATSQHDFPVQSCVLGDWYECRHTNPPFLGCCMHNPCRTNGCGKDNVRAAYLNGSEFASFFPIDATLHTRPSNTTSSATSTYPSSLTVSTSGLFDAATSATSAVSTSSASEATESPQSLAPVRSNTPDLSTGAIAGIAGGGAFALIVVMALILLFCTKRGKQYSETMSEKLSFSSDKSSGVISYSDYPTRPQTPRPNAPWDPSAVSRPRTTRNTSSPNISDPDSSTSRSNERWSEVPSQVSELAGSEPAGLLYPRVAGGRRDAVDYVVRCPGYPGPQRYQAYRPSG